MKKACTTWFLFGLLVAPAARASLVTGTLNATGSIELSSAGIEFVSNLITLNSPASSQGGGFMALEGTTATIQNIDNPPDAVGPLDVSDFLTFSAAPNLSFTLTFLDAGIFGSSGCTATPSAAGQICSPDGSPLNFLNGSATSSVASFSIAGIERDSSTGDTIDFTGLFTLPFSNQSFQGILSTLDGGGSVTTSFSAEFDTSVALATPEPSPMGMVAFALLAMGCFFCRARLLKRGTRLQD